MKRTDFSQLQGIENVKRAIEIALAGYHDLYILSKPHNGNTTLAFAIRNIIMGLQTRHGLSIGKTHFSDYPLKLRYLNSNKQDQIIIEYYRDNRLIHSSFIEIHQDKVDTGSDMSIICPRVTLDHYMNQSPAEASENVVERVWKVHKFDHDLFKLSSDSIILLKQAAEKLTLTAAAIGKIHNIASTIAALDKPLGMIMPEHMAEAIQYFTPISEDHE